jgi:hypothetical protein
MIWSETLVEFCSVLGTGDLSMLVFTSELADAAKEFDAAKELEAKESFAFASVFKLVAKELN